MRLKESALFGVPSDSERNSVSWKIYINNVSLPFWPCKPQSLKVYTYSLLTLLLKYYIRFAWSSTFGRSSFTIIIVWTGVDGVVKPTVLGTRLLGSSMLYLLYRSFFHQILRLDNGTRAPILNRAGKAGSIWNRIWPRYCHSKPSRGLFGLNRFLKYSAELPLTDFSRVNALSYSQENQHTVVNSKESRRGALQASSTAIKPHSICKFHFLTRRERRFAWSLLIYTMLVCLTRIHPRVYFQGPKRELNPTSRCQIPSGPSIRWNLNKSTIYDNIICFFPYSWNFARLNACHTTS